MLLCRVLVRQRGVKFSLFASNIHVFIHFLLLSTCLAAVGLTEKVVVDYQNKRLMKEQLDQIESLKIVQAAASDEDSALALFREIDADGSGQLDESEFGNLLTCMGLSMSPEQVCFPPRFCGSWCWYW